MTSSINKTLESILGGIIEDNHLQSALKLLRGYGVNFGSPARIVYKQDAGKDCIVVIKFGSGFVVSDRREATFVEALMPGMFNSKHSFAECINAIDRDEKIFAFLDKHGMQGDEILAHSTSLIARTAREWATEYVDIIDEKTRELHEKFGGMKVVLIAEQS